MHRKIVFGAGNKAVQVSAESLGGAKEEEGGGSDACIATNEYQSGLATYRQCGPSIGH